VWLWCGGWVWLRFAGRSGRPRGSRRSVMLIFGDWAPQDLCSSHVRCLKSSAPAAAGTQATHRGVVCASRGCSGRLASRNGLGRVQRELVSLLRVVGVGVGSGVVVVQVAISQQ
jgi:hypothetical protein